MMMPNFKIPEAFLPGFRALASFTSEDSRKIADVLDKMKVGTTRAEFKTNITEVLVDPHTKEVADAIFSTGSLLASAWPEKSPMATELRTSIHAQIPSLSEEEAQKFENNLSIIFEKSEKLRLTFKAYNLIAENCNSYVSSPIMTDFRPVFDHDTLESKFAVIVHSLKLEYVHADKNDEFFVSMTLDELVNLQNQIARALKKEDYMKRNIQNFQFVTINT